VLLLMGPGTIGLAAVQVNLFVNTLLATSQGTGAVSWLNYGFRLMYLPIGLFGVSIATAVLPAISRHAAVNDLPGIRQTVTRGMTMMLMLNVPATFGLLTLATPIVQLLFERGRFGPFDTAGTASALRLYAVGLVGYSAVRIVSPIFYALGRSRVPILVSLGTIALNVALNVALVRVMGFSGLALGTSIAALANGAILLVLLRRALHGIDGKRLGIAVGKIATAGLVMAAVATGLEREMLAALPGAGLVRQSIRLTVAIGGALASLAAAARLLRIREFDEAALELRARLR
jgi:putative peptidoglycan lipid II flippase